MAFGPGMMGAGIGAGLVMAVVGILLGALFLWISAAKIFKMKDKSFKTPLTIAAIVGVVSYVLGFVPLLNMLGAVVAIVLAVWLIKTRYNVDWVKAILVWLVYFVLSIVAGMIIAFLIGGMVVGGLMGAGMMS